MKFQYKSLLILVIFGVLLTYAGCKHSKTEPESVTDQQLDKLNGAWNTTAVTRDGVDESANYTNFKLTLTGTKGQSQFGFTTDGRPDLSAWPASGNFTFDTTNPTTVLSRNDTPPVSVTYSVTTTSLSMSFQYNGGGYHNRVGVVNGVWVFTFSK